MTDPVTERLLLRAESADDLPALSALVQDMALLANDIAYDAKRRRLTLMGNRYRWEANEPTRVRTALRADFVQHLQHRAMPENPATVLALLALTHEDGVLEFRFANGTALRAEVETLDLTLEDLSGPWGAKAVPRHD